MKIYSELRTSIHHDHEHQTFHKRGYTQIETDPKYLSFHIGHVAAALTLVPSIALAIEALSSSRVMLASPC